MPEKNDKQPSHQMTIYIAECDTCDFEWGCTDGGMFYKNLLKEPRCPKCGTYLKFGKKEE